MGIRNGLATTRTMALRTMDVVLFEIPRWKIGFLQDLDEVLELVEEVSGAILPR